MPELDTTALFQIFDPAFLAIAFVGLLVLILLFKLPKSDAPALRQELAKKEQELRQALNGLSRTDALASERKTEIERLNGDLSKLRQKLDDDAERAQAAAARISGLEVRLQAEREEQGQAAVRHQAMLADDKIEKDQLIIQIAELRDLVDTAAKDKQLSTGTINRLQAELKAQGDAAADKIEILSKVRADMEMKFGELAREALAVQGEAFSKSNIERLNATLTPLKEHVGHFEQELKAVHKATVDDRAALKAEIKQLSQRSEDISKEAIALTRALKSDNQKQGAWGEMILSSILERSGLREGEEYETQAHRTGMDGGRLRPDVVVRIPGDKTIVIDSKVSLSAYTEAVNAESEIEAASARKRHLVSIRSHINSLSEKGYQTAESSTVDYVILFVPIEGALSEALREDGQLTEYALDRHITIATPTTLMMALRTVSHVWAVERRNQNAEEIARRAGILYDKVSGFIGNMEDVGKKLDQAQSAHQNAFGQLSRGNGNMLWQVETLKALGAKTSKKITAEFEIGEEVVPRPAMVGIKK